MLTADCLFAQEKLPIAGSISLSCSEGAVVDMARFLHSAIYNVTFPADAKQVLTLDFDGNGEITYNPQERVLEGYAVNADTKIYFAVFSDNLNLQKTAVGRAMSVNGEKLMARLPLGLENANVQISVSYRSISQARKFLKEECIGRGIGTLKNNYKKMCGNIFMGITATGDSSAQKRLNEVVWESLMEIGKGTDNVSYLQGAIDGKDYCVWDTLATHFQSVKIKTDHVSGSGFLKLWQLVGLSPDIKKKRYILNAPILQQTEIRLGNGKTVKIIRNCEKDNAGKVTFNGKKVRKRVLKDKKFRKGGTLIYDIQ